MLAQLRRSFVLLGFVVFSACMSWAQTSTLQGDVKGADGQPLKGAMIVLDRTDIKGHYQVKTDKHGHWLYTGLPMGTYNVSCMVDGKVADSVKGVKGGYGDDNPPVNFDLSKMAAQQAALNQAAQTGQLSKEQEHSMSKEDKEKFEAAAKQRSEAMKKNKALNDAFNGGMDAVKKAQADQDKAQKTTDYQAAIDSFNKANELDASQVAIWDNLGLAYVRAGEFTNWGRQKQIL